jgi:hypothetical protein
MKAYGGVGVQIHIFLHLSTSWLASRPGRFTAGERAPGTHLVGPRADLDDVEKRKFLTLSGLELRSLCRPARSQSLYRLRYPGNILQEQFRNKL